MTEPQREKIMEAGSVLGVLGIEASDTNVAQMRLYIEAFRKFSVRNYEYQDLWMQGGVPDNLHHIDSKFARMKHMKDAKTLTTFKDSALDMINYSVFAVRNKMAGRT